MQKIQNKHTNCQHCRNYEFIINQLQLLKKEIHRKNERIVELEMFIEHLSKMALTDSTESQAQNEHNPMDLTFKKNDREDSEHYRSRSVAHFNSVSGYATQSQPHQEGLIAEFGNTNMMYLLSKRDNESTNIF